MPLSSIDISILVVPGAVAFEDGVQRWENQRFWRIFGLPIKKNNGMVKWRKKMRMSLGRTTRDPRDGFVDRVTHAGDLWRVLLVYVLICHDHGRLRIEFAALVDVVEAVALHKIDLVVACSHKQNACAIIFIIFQRTRIDQFSTHNAVVLDQICGVVDVSTTLELNYLCYCLR